MVKTCAVIVTYNRKEMLKECIDSLLQQTLSLNGILIVNNNSSDGTREFLDNLSAENPIIFSIHLNKNIGGAGGFAVGMKKAYEKGYDWLWIMDDDAEPEQDCLEKLIKEAEGQSEPIGFIAPIIMHKSSKKIQVYHHKHLNKALTSESPIPMERILSDKSIEIDANAFVGPLISKEAVKNVGFPRGEFFIWLDDTEYTHRITRKAKGILLTTAVIYHKDLSVNGDLVKSSWKKCYGFRNKLLWVNDSLTGFDKIYGIIGVIAEYSKELIKVTIQPIWSKNRKFVIKHLTKSIVEGLKGKSGIFIEPIQYIKSLK
ncbi:glycosyltransferase family 2 protein [Bacillaceae bacterium Marseille-Q3522]|nr:glycosyltransferase family 2 protein [Bacillaceae bacterium Marseille-Q3522]